MHSWMPHLICRAWRARRAEVLATLCCAIPLAMGCGTGTIRAENDLPIVAVRLLDIGRAYNQFQADHGRPPQAPADLRRHVTEPDAWISPRDGKPFVIFWGFKPAPATAATNGIPIIAHEASGSEGTRYVLTEMGNAAVWSEAEFQAYQSSVGRHEP